MNLKWLLAFSLSLNVVLLGAWQWKSSRQPMPPSPSSSASPSLLSSSAPPLELSRPAAPRPDTDVPLVKPPRPKPSKAPAAALIEVEDYPEFIQKLRAAGLSEDTIATLIVAEIFFRGIEDNVALQWRLNAGELTQDQFDAEQRRVQLENEATLEVLLGKDGVRRFQLDHDFQLKQLVDNGSFPPETVGKFFDLRKAHQERVRAWEDEYRAKGLNPADYGDKRYEMEKAYQEEMAKALGADVASRLLTETDWKLQNLRRQMAAVKISDQEYAQINQAFQNFRQEQQRISALQGRGDLASDEASSQIRTLDQQMKDQVATILGPDRHAEYEKQNDHRYRQLKQFGRTNDLNDEQMDHVYGVMRTQWTQQQDLHKQLQAKQITREQYNALLEQSNSQTRNALQRYMGANRYERLKRATGHVP